MKLRLVLDSNRYDLGPSDPDNAYHVPHLYFDELHLPHGALAPLSNDTTRAHPSVRFRLVPTSVGVFRLISTLDQAMQQLRAPPLQFSHVETDELLLLMSPDNLYIMAITYTVSVSIRIAALAGASRATKVSILHTIFAAMAFKNEISFWASSKDLYGLSRRSVVGNAVCSIVLFLFLWGASKPDAFREPAFSLCFVADSAGTTSWIVIVTMGCHAAIDVWKCTKILGWSRKLTEAEEHTNQIDATGMRYLWWLLWPLMTGWALYSLFSYRHRSWYSWAITSAAHGVYGFGFLMMWPQIFVNYRVGRARALLFTP